MKKYTYNKVVVAGLLIVILLSGCSTSSSDTISSATKKTNAVFPIEETGINTLFFTI